MLKDKNVLITGASRGIGKAISIKFAENKAFIGINYNLSESNAMDTLKKVEEKGGDGVLLKADVSKYKEVDQMIEYFLKKVGNIDILVNNAGIYKRNSFEKIRLRDWDRTMRTNLTSSFYLCRKIAPIMKLGSRIIFISSQLAFRGSSHGADYATTKSGLLGLMRSLALELAEKKILVNAVAPGLIDTDIIKHYSKEMRLKRIKEIPLKRIGTPEDIANVCLFLASKLSNYITGETINVNGGIYIH
jgi:3-oxoacyl-[acyl-carrier protein] reductase